MKPCLPMPRGRLRPATADDLDDLERLLHDPRVRRYLCDDVVLPRDSVAAMLARGEQLDPSGLGLWAIEHLGDRFAGIAGLQPIQDEAAATSTATGSIEPIIAVQPRYWGDGLASEALGALLLHAREALGLPRLLAAVDQPNLRSHRLMHRLGFKALDTTPGPAHGLLRYELRFDNEKAPK